MKEDGEHLQRIPRDRLPMSALNYKHKGKYNFGRLKMGVRTGSLSLLLEVKKKKKLNVAFCIPPYKRVVTCTY